MRKCMRCTVDFDILQNANVEEQRIDIGEMKRMLAHQSSSLFRMAYG
jgi:hypothetical protein